MSKKFIAIGDIHGCLKSIEALLQKLIQAGFQDRTFVFIGDYIDRGPNAKETISYLIEFSRTHKCVFLRGNHEQMLLGYLNGEPIELWQRNGGKSTFRSYLNENKKFELPYQHLHFFRNTRTYYQSEDFFFVHAGLDPDATIEEALEATELQDDFLWTREHLKVDSNVWEKTVVFGHTPVKTPIIRPNMIGIDTGCVFKHLPELGRLCAVALPEKEFFYQDCLDNPNPY